MTHESGNPKVAAVLIAAGASSRLGQPKQLVLFQEKPLINHCIDVLEGSELDSINVVLGCRAAEIGSVLKRGVVQIDNPSWKLGMGTSISSGVKSLGADIDGVLIALVDQYKLTSELINEMIALFQKDAQKLVVSKYGNGVIGPPAIFPQRLFLNLAGLKGDRGAGKIIKQEKVNSPSQVLEVYFEEGHLDVDTAEDLEKMKK